jgi:DNA-binding IclR family transcriptional regulator
MVEQSFHIMGRNAKGLMQTGTQSIDRAAQLLVMVVEREELSTLGELADASGLPKSTVSRVVSALERQGLVQRNGARGAIRPGPVLLGLARRGISHDDLAEVSRPALERLGELTGETINLAAPLPRGGEHYLAQVDSRHFVGTGNWVGRRLPSHATAVGKVFIAFGAARIPRGPLERFTDHTITDPGRLAQELAAVRERGYATTLGELESGLVAVAAPVLAGTGKAIAGISVSGPDFRLAPDRLAEIGRHVVGETTRLSARLGHATKGAA